MYESKLATKCLIRYLSSSWSMLLALPRLNVLVICWNSVLLSLSFRFLICRLEKTIGLLTLTWRENGTWGLTCDCILILLRNVLVLHLEYKHTLILPINQIHWSYKLYPLLLQASTNECFQDYIGKCDCSDGLNYREATAEPEPTRPTKMSFNLQTINRKSIIILLTDSKPGSSENQPCLVCFYVVVCLSFRCWCCSEHQHHNQNEFKKFYKVLIYICCQDLLTDHHHSEREKGSTIVFKQ